jgi:NAD(P)-dependent dehydrogenase (short-subunit alcohol dehydrogenase family)
VDTGLAGKICAVTGASRGIGREVARLLCAEGASVLLVARGEDALLEAVGDCEGGHAAALALDVTGEDAGERIVDAATERFGRLDVLVNNAAYQGKAVERFEELSAERVEKVFRVNVVAMFHLVRHALPHLKEGAAIINVASIQAYKPRAAILDYAATKGAIVTFTKGLAQELIERGIRVNCVAPGPVWTPLIAQSFSGEHVKDFGKSSPMGRPAQPAELAPAFVFLASDESRYVNGEVLGVTGGQILA